MKTVITQKINDYKIIKNIGNAGGMIDPIETKKIVAVEIGKTDIAKQINGLKKQMNIYMSQAHQARRAKNDSKIADEKKETS